MLPSGMRTGVLALLLAVAVSCGRPESFDYVAYKPPVGEVDGAATSMLLVLAEGPGALLVTRTFGRGTAVATGPVTTAEWEEIRATLARTRYFPEAAQSPRENPPTLQIYARLGEIRIDLTRDPLSPLEPEVAEVRDRLDALAAGLTVAEDPVAALAPFLASPMSGVRGPAVVALLQLRADLSWPPEVRRDAEKSLQAHLAVEEDREIVDRIRER